MDIHLKFTKTTLKTPRSLSNNFILHIFEDRQGTLWIGTLDGGLNKYDRDNDEFTSPKHNPANKTNISSNLINYIFEDSHDRLWIATENGLNILDRKTGKFSSFRNNQNDPTSIGDNTINQIFEDSQKTCGSALFMAV